MGCGGTELAAVSAVLRQTNREDPCASCAISVSDNTEPPHVSSQLSGLSLPEHWVRHFFLAQTSLELQQNEDAFRLYSELQDAGFARSSYVMAQIAVAYHNLRGTYHHVRGAYHHVRGTYHNLRNG